MLFRLLFAKTSPHAPRNSRPCTAPRLPSIPYFASLTSCNLFAFMSFADPHPLNPFVSYRWETTGGRGDCYRLPPILQTATHSSKFRILFKVPYPVTPLFATLTKTAGVYTNSSHSGTHCIP